jgi:hypothetical protein
VPLCERPAAHPVELAALLAWHQAALRGVAEVGDAWARQDDGPTREDLATELQWLLDDAVGGEQRDGGAAPRPASWKALAREGGEGRQGAAERHILLREPLHTLGAPAF